MRYSERYQILYLFHKKYANIQINSAEKWEQIYLEMIDILKQCNNDKYLTKLLINAYCELAAQNR